MYTKVETGGKCLSICFFFNEQKIIKCFSFVHERDRHTVCTYHVCVLILACTNIDKKVLCACVHSYVLIKKQ